MAISIVVPGDVDQVDRQDFVPDHDALAAVHGWLQRDSKMNMINVNQVQK